MKNKILLCAIALGSIVMIDSCKKKKPDPENPTDIPYDQSALLQNYSSNLIVPAYNLLKQKTDSLEMCIMDFNSIPTLPGLQAVRHAWLSVSKQFPYVSTYEFGPAGSALFRTSHHIFPTDTTQINSNIASGSYDLHSAAQTDAIGLPAMDYLLYGYNKSDIYILNLFITNANRRQYLFELCSYFKYQLNTIINQWNSTYSATFNAATGNSASSSLSLLVNQLNFDYEISKNARLGIPLGKQTLGIAMPQKCEAYYSGYSLVLLQECLKALENIYLGRTQAGADGQGLDDYLEFMGRTSLNSSIKTKFTELKSLVAAIPGPLSTAVTASPASVDAAYAKCQELLVLLKTDMPSALSVSITYVDGDGD